MTEKWQTVWHEGAKDNGVLVQEREELLIVFLIRGGFVYELIKGKQYQFKKDWVPFCEIGGKFKIVSFFDIV